MNIRKTINISTTILGAISSLFGGFDSTLKVLVVLMTCDYISGISLGIIGKSKRSDDGKLNSRIGYIGILKKVLIMLCILIANMLDIALMQKNTFRNAAIFFYIANESLSLIENLSSCGIPFPESIKKSISVLSKKE